MIRFAQDWADYYDPIPDMKTSNHTFLTMAAKYKEMGVKNWRWPLTLMQRELQGVDPHAPDLSLEVKEMIAQECKFNPWYYFREVVRVPPKGSPHPVPLRANRGNLAMFWLFFCHVPLFLIQPRQTGKSVSTDTLTAGLLWVFTQNTDIFLITKDHTLRKGNIERIKGIRDAMPSWLPHKGPNDPNNQEELGCKLLNNTYKTGVSQGDEKSAEKLGRGLTVPVLHIDEAPFIDYIGHTYPAAMSSGNAARDNAAAAGMPYGSIITTTAGKINDRDGEFVYNIIKNAFEWNEMLFDAKDEEELHAIITRNGGKQCMVNITMSHRQLGYTDEWLKKKIMETSSFGEKADRDYLNIWTSGAQGSPLTGAQNEAIAKSEVDPVENDVHPEGLYVLRKYFNDEEFQYVHDNSHFIIGLDTSDAIGRDGIGMVWTNVYDMSTVAASTVNETNLLRYATWLCHLLVKYPNSTLVVERKSSGQAIMDILFVMLHKKGIDPFKRIYNSVVDNAAEDPNSFNEIQRSMAIRDWQWYDKYKKYFGFNTTGGSRELLYGKVLQEAAKRSVTKIRDRKLSGEIRGLMVKKGRIDHSSGKNDDMVISWLFTHWLASYGRNLQYYGITSNLLMRAVAADGRQINTEEVKKRDAQTQLVEAIEDLQRQLKMTRDESMKIKLTHRLAHLTSKIEVSDIVAETQDELMRPDKTDGMVVKLKSGVGQRRPLEVRGLNTNIGRQQSQHISMGYSR